MTKREKILLLKRVEKMLYDQRRYLEEKYDVTPPTRCLIRNMESAVWGIREAEIAVFNLRKKHE